MNIVVNMVTVYFVGLVHIYTPSGTSTRNIIVPDASVPVWRDGIRLHSHQTNIIIKGLTAGQSACNTLSGSWDGTDTCTVPAVFGADITLPPHQNTSSSTVIPSIKDLCCDNSTMTIKSGYLTNPAMYTVRLDTDKTLGTCADKEQWISYLTTDGGALRIDFLRPNPTVTKTVMLDSEAIVWIKNEPVNMMPGHARAHWWWYYEMYDGATTCKHLPGPPEEAVDCPPSYNIIGASGEVFCSNSTYP